MRVYFDRIENIRKHKKMSQSILCLELDIARTTFWYWKQGIRDPNEKQTRKIAEALETSVSNISDLKPIMVKSDQNIAQFEKSWFSLFNTNISSYKNQTNKLVDLLIGQQDQLWQSGVIIKSLLTAMNVMFYVKTTNQKYVTANEAFLNNNGLSSEFRVLNSDDNSFFSRKEAIENTLEDTEVLNTGTAISDVEKYIPGSKKKKWGVISKTPILDSLGNIVGLVGMFIDITKQKKNESELKIFKKALDSASDAISMWTPNETQNYQNIAFERLFGSNSHIQSNQGPQPSSLLDCNKDMLITKTIESGKQWSGEIKMVNRYKEISDIFLRAYPIKDINNKVIGLVRVHTDISERTKFEKERLMYRKQLETMVNERTTELLNMNRKLEKGLLMHQQLEGNIQEQEIFLANQKNRLNFFYKLSEIIEKQHITLDNICTRIVNLIPKLWVNSAVTCARIKIYNEIYSSDLFSESQWKIAKAIKNNGKVIGTIEVYSLKLSSILPNQTPFSKDDINLMQATSIYISQTVSNINK